VSAFRLPLLVPYLAVLGSVTALDIGTSLEKQLFPLIGAQRTTALRVGFSALLLVALWHPWRTRLDRHDVVSIDCYGGKPPAIPPVILGGEQRMLVSTYFWWTREHYSPVTYGARARSAPVHQGIQG